MDSEEETNEEFTLDPTTPSKESTTQRLKEFSYYLTDSVEKNLNFCLALLEGHLTPKKSNSTPITTISALATPIPYIGKGLSSALQQGEIYILNKIDEKNSRKVADLVYFFNDNKEEFRRKLIEASVEVFWSFEAQFRKLSCEGGSRRAMQKLGRDAANRIFTHFLKNNLKNYLKEDFCRGVLLGDSLKNKFGVASGKTVENSEEKWKTSSIYSRVGLFFEQSGHFYKNEETNCDKYGFRRVLDFEKEEEIRRNWILVDSSSVKYLLRKEELAELVPQSEQYMKKKNVWDEAQLDRDQKHEQLIKDNEELKKVLENFGPVLEDLSKSYESLTNNKSEVIETIKEEKIVNKERHEILRQKLTEIHSDVLETQQGQIHLQHSTEAIKSEICEIRTKQEEFSNATNEVKESIQKISQQTTVTLTDLVQVQKIAKVVNEVKEKIQKSDLEPKVRKEISNIEPKLRKEVRRGLKRLFK